MLDRFKAASPNQQLQLAALGICVVAAFVFALWFAFVRTTYQPLFAGLKMSDASAIVAELDRKKIPYRLADGGATILVPPAMADGARLDVMGGDVPLKGSVGFELFNKSDMGLTDFAQKINYQRALQGELERTIMTLDGVDTARVHLSLGEDRLFRDDQVAPKASVTMRMAKGVLLSQSTAQGVKRLVAAAVPKMDAADVVILDEQGRAVNPQVVNAIPAEPESPLFEEKRAIEEYYSGRIRAALAGSGLPTDITVGVSAAAGAGLGDWAPATRDFPLRIALASATPLAADLQERARTLVSKAVGAAAAQNDEILFAGSSPRIEPAVAMDAPVESAARRRPSAAPLVLKREEESGAFDWALVGVPALVVFLAGILMVWKLRGSRRLSPREQQDFAERLRAVLGERDGHAASRS
jgi:flagellar M-ring protein FliF